MPTPETEAAYDTLRKYYTRYAVAILLCMLASCVYLSIQYDAKATAACSIVLAWVVFCLCEIAICIREFAVDVGAIHTDRA